MLRKFFARFGYVPVEAVDESDRACGQLAASLAIAAAELEARDAADRLAAVSARVPSMLARHA